MWKYGGRYGEFKKLLLPITIGSETSVMAIKKESRLVEMFTYAFLVVMVVIVTLNLAWNSHEDEIFLHLKYIKMYFNDNLLLKIAANLLIYHATFTISCPLFVITYSILQIKFQIALLIENVESLNLNVDGNVSELLIEDVNYQKEINLQLITCLHHHQRIKRYVNVIYFARLV